MDFITYLKTQTKLSAETENRLEEILTRKTYSKGGILREVNSMSKKVMFIEAGFARVFYFKDGKDITSFFLQDNSFSLPVDSVFYQKNCRYGIEAIMQTTVVSFNYFEVETVFGEIPELSKFTQLQIISHLKSINDKLYSIQFQNAPERYSLMLETYPDILKQVPLGHIASFRNYARDTKPN